MEVLQKSLQAACYCGLFGEELTLSISYYYGP